MGSEQDISQLNNRMNRLESLLERLVEQTTNNRGSIEQGGQSEERSRHMEDHVSQRFERVESLLLTMAESQARPSVQAGQSTSTNILMQQEESTRASSMRSSELPSLSGEKKDSFTVITWLGRLELLFNGRNMTIDEEKIKTAGMAILDLEWGEWFRLNYVSLQKLSWGVFCEEVKKKFLPPDWEFAVLCEIRVLRMGDRETFEKFAERAARLQTMVKQKVSDEQLADHLLAGVPSALALDIQDSGVHLEVPFQLSKLIDIGKKKHSRLLELRRDLQSSVTSPARQRSGLVVSGRQSADSSQRASVVVLGQQLFDANKRKQAGVWRFKCYFAEQGICRWCKQSCGSAVGACGNQRSSDMIRIPITYQAPPMPIVPVDAPAPEPPAYLFANEGGVAGRSGGTTNRASGVSGLKKTGVAGVTVENEEVDVAAVGMFPDLGRADLEAYGKLIDKLSGPAEEDVVEEAESDNLTHIESPNQIASPLIITFVVNGIKSRALPDTGAGTNLISLKKALELRLIRRPLIKPVSVIPALMTEPKSFIFKEFAFANVKSDAPLNFTFGPTVFKIAPLAGNYDIILGTPFLHKHKLEVSVASRYLRHARNGLIFCENDKYMLEKNKKQNQFVAAVFENLEKVNDVAYLSSKEEQMLKEFEDVFPEELPAVCNVTGQEEEEIFPKEKQNVSSHTRHRIKLTDANIVINERQYGYPRKHLEAWRKLLDLHIKAGRIRRSTSQYASPSMILPKKDPTALPRLICDYRTLNKYTIKDRGPLPKVEEALRIVAEGKVFSCLDQIHAFFQTLMNEDDIPLTAIKTPWGLFEWVVMPMGLTNAPETQQRRCEEALGDLINKTCVVYIDDIVVFSQNAEEHEHHLRQVLQKLREANLYCGRKKTHLFSKRVKFLGHIITPEGIQADDEKIEKVANWRRPKSPKQLKEFLGTVQWMRKFIDGLARYAGTLSPLTSSKKSKEQFVWTEKEKDAFNNIKRIITTLPVLRNIDYESNEPIWLFTDASGEGIGAALFQGADWETATPAAYESRTLTMAERNYPVHEQELLAVVHALEKWKLLLLGLRVNIMTDHHSLVHLLTQKNLSRRQARWLETLSQFDLDFKYLQGQDNSVADALSRLNISAAALNESRTSLGNKLIDDIKSGYSTDPFCLKLTKTLPLRANCTWREGLMYVDDRIVIPKVSEITNTLITLAHTSVGHLGSRKTSVKLQSQFFWPGLTEDVDQFVKQCDTCQRYKSRTTRLTGTMQSTEVPSRPMSAIALDFVVPMPKVQGYDMILSCTCRLTGFVWLIAANQRDTAERKASRLFASWISIFGAPDSMIGDRDKVWTSRFWQELTKKMGIQVNLTTAYHPQADGRAERTNKTLNELLRTAMQGRQGRWLQCLPVVEYAVNSATNASTQTLPMQFVFARQPRLFPIQTEGDDGCLEVQDWIAERQTEWAKYRDRLWESRVNQAVQYNKKRAANLPAKVGDLVLIDSSSRAQVVGGKVAKLRARYDGPYEVTKVLNEGRDFQVKLGAEDRTHNTFQGSKLKLYKRSETSYGRL